MNAADIKRVIEAALLCASAPLPAAALRRMFPDDWAVDLATIEAALHGLQADWSGRGVELVALASGWRFQTVPELAAFIERLNPERPPRYSRAVLETLAIIAYRQPVTRGDIEAIRGVAVSSTIMKTLEDRGWIEAVGHKDVVGRPALWATTPQFLDDLSLPSLQALPALARPSEGEEPGLEPGATPAAHDASVQQPSGVQEAANSPAAAPLAPPLVSKTSDFSPDL